MASSAHSNVFEVLPYGGCISELSSRHKQSFQRVALKDCQLLVGKWTSLFTRIAGILSKLKQVILSRYLISSGGIEFYLPTQGKLTTSVAMKLQTFIIEGGAFPPDSYIEASIGLPINIAQGPFDDEDEEQEEDQED